MKRGLCAFVVLVCTAGWLASAAAACHSEISASINCSGVVTYTASAWNGSGATTSSRTNSDVRVWASVDGGATFNQVGSGHFGQDNGFSFSGSFSAGSASSVVVKIQEVAKWGSGDAPAAARTVTVAKQGCTGGGSTCPTQGMVTENGPITVANGMASVNFTVASGCQNVQLSLVSYKAPGPQFDEQTADQQKIVDYKTATYSAGTWGVTVAVPSCYYQIDFVYGARIDQLGPAGTNNFYGKQGRLISSLNGGTSSCTTENTGGGTPPTPPTSPTPTATPTPTFAIAVEKLQRIGSTATYSTDPLTATVGQTISYEINVRDTGNVMLTITLSDPRCDAGTMSPSGGQGVAPSGTVTFTCTHLLTSADTGSFVNTADVTGTAGNGQRVTGSASVTAQVTAAAPAPGSSSGVLGATKTVVHKSATAHKKATAHRKAVVVRAKATRKTKHTVKAATHTKKVVKTSRPAHPVVSGAHFTG